MYFLILEEVNGFQKCYGILAVFIFCSRVPVKLKSNEIEIQIQESKKAYGSSR